MRRNTPIVIALALAGASAVTSLAGDQPYQVVVNSSRQTKQPTNHQLAAYF